MAPGALSVTRTYAWATALWLVVMVATGAAVSFRLLSTAVGSQTPAGDSGREPDDAVAVVAAFGPPEEDWASSADPLDSSTGTRVMIYRRQRVRVMFFRRSWGSPPRVVWKLVGFTEPDGRTVVAGDEALRRLIAGR